MLNYSISSKYHYRRLSIAFSLSTCLKDEESAQYYLPT